MEKYEFDEIHESELIKKHNQKIIDDFNFNSKYVRKNLHRLHEAKKYSLDYTVSQYNKSYQFDNDGKLRINMNNLSTREKFSCIQILNPSDDFKLKNLDVLINGIILTKHNFGVSDAFNGHCQVGDELFYNLHLDSCYLDEFKKNSRPYFHDNISFEVDFEGDCQEINLCVQKNVDNSMNKVKKYKNKKVIIDNDATNPENDLDKTKLFFQQDSIDVNFNKSNNFQQIIKLSGKLSGVFVEGVDVNSLKNIKMNLMYSNILLYSLDEVDIRLYCEKITDNLFYLPFDNDKNYNKTYDGNCVNFDKIEYSGLTISGCEFKGTIHYFIPNLLDENNSSVYEH